jgi:signal transduction histidine kinase
MGIGLSVSRSIIEAHRGNIYAALNDGPGSTFTFSLPCGHETTPWTSRTENTAMTNKENLG